MQQRLKHRCVRLHSGAFTFLFFSPYNLCETMIHKGNLLQGWIFTVTAEKADVHGISSTNNHSWGLLEGTDTTLCNSE